MFGKDSGAPSNLHLRQLGLTFWWGWSYVLFFSDTFFVNAGGLSEEMSLRIWVASCVGYVALTAVAVPLAQRISPILERGKSLAFFAFVSCLGTLLIAVAFSQPLSPLPGIALAGGFLTGIGTAWLSLSWGELFGKVGMAKTGSITSLSLFLGVILNGVIVSLPRTAGIAITTVLPALSAWSLWRSRTVKPEQVEDSPLESFSPSVFSWKPLISIGAMGAAFGYIKGAGVTQTAYSLSPYALFAGVAIMAFAFAFWTGILKRNLNVDKVYRASMFALIASIAFIPFLDGPIAGVASAVIVACYDCFDMVVWAFMANIVVLAATPAVKVFGSGRMLNHLGLIVGAFLGWLCTFVEPTYDAIRYLLPCLLMLGLVLCAFVSLGEVNFFATPLPSARKLSAPNVNLSKNCDNVSSRFSLTPREREVMEYLGKGRNASYISEVLFISENTVKSHMKHIYRKLGINTQQQLLDMLEDPSD